LNLETAMTLDTGKLLPRLASSRPLPSPARTRAPVLASGPGDRAFKVLQSSRAPAQLSLFPPPGFAARNGR